MNQSEDARHRRPGSASMRMPEESGPPPTFFRAMDESPALRGVLVLGLAFFGFGVYDVIAGPGIRHLTGLGFAVFGGLLVASLALRYERPGLADPSWSKTLSRRTARFLLVHTWRVVLALLIANAVVYLVAQVL